MTIKGYGDQKKRQDVATQYVTVSPVRAEQHGLDVVSHSTVYQVGTDAAEAVSQENELKIIGATAHAARVGDVLRFTTGVLSDYEFRVAAVTANAITPSEYLPAAPSAGDAFTIFRHRYLLVDSDGALPVALADSSIGAVGAASPTDAQLQGGDDSGTLRAMTVDSSGNQLVVGVGAAGTPAGGVLSVQGVTSGTAVTVAATDLDIRPLDSSTDSVEAAQFGTWSVGLDVGAQVAATQSGSWTVGLTGTVPLPTGAATAAKQDTGNTSLASIDTKAGSLDTKAVQQTLGSQAATAGLAVTLSSRHEAVATPVATHLSDGTDFITASALTAAQKTLSTATKLLGTLGIALGWDGVTHRELSCDTSGNLNVNTAGTAAIAYQAKGKIAGSSLTGSYATLLNPTSDLRIIQIFNSCNQTILVSLDGGTTDTFELEAGESTSVDLATNGMKFDNAVNISAKHGGVAPTAGSVRVTGIG
jgi:hypothetical protein